MIRILSAAALLLSAFAAAPAQAQLGGTEATAVRDDFTPPQGEPVVLVFRPDVRVGAQTMGGMNEPNVEWTEAAKALIADAMRQEQAARGLRFAFVPEMEGAEGELVADYSALFKTVAESAFQYSLFPGSRLPTQKRRFDYTLGDEAAALRRLGGDYGLFFYTYDSYGSTGRKALQVLGLLAGVGMVPSGAHIGYAGLVDLRTGDLLWLNADVQMGGDVRTEEGARKRVAQLLEEFPISGTPGGTRNTGPVDVAGVPAAQQGGTVLVEVPPENPGQGETAAPATRVVLDEDGNVVVEGEPEADEDGTPE